MSIKETVRGILKSTCCPPPDPSPPVSSAMLLRSKGSAFISLHGEPVKLFQAIQCCDSIPGVPNSRWPAISIDAMDYFAQFGANMFHMRLGPFWARCADESNPNCGETEWADIGGPYNADGTFNEAFFTEVENLVSYARSKNYWVEVNIIDTWYCKHAQLGDVQMPWPAATIAACGRIAGDPIQTAYVTKIVKLLNKYDNIIWLLDNEGDNINGAKQEWWSWQIQTIRAAEQASGSVNVHMIGANQTFLNGADYAYTHARAALVQPIANLPTINNERNPSFTPNQEASNFKAALDRGLVYAYWRDSMSADGAVATLELFRDVWNGKTPSGGCYAPDGEDPLWDPNPKPGAGGLDASKERNAVKAAQAAIGDVCGADAPASLEALAQKLRDAGFCSSKNNDSVFIMQGKYGFEFHAVAYGNGCWTTNQNVNPKNTWIYNGPLPS